MKGGFLAFAAAMALGASAGSEHAHNHEVFHNLARQATSPQASNGSCGCGAYTVWVTSYGQATLYIPPPPPPPPTSTAVVAVATVVVVPTPAVTTYATPGTYTIPAVTVVLTSTTTVCAATSSSVAAGTYTVGGVTTVVATSTTVVCPVAAVSTSAGVITSFITTTTYVCPSAGTYTIAPIITTVLASTVLVYPTPASYPPGTYVQPQVVTTITETDYVVFCPYTAVVPAPAASTPPAAASTGAPAPAIGGGGNQWAITYTPYTTTGQCKAAGDVAADLAIIKSKGFSAVRLYATDCSGLANVGAGAAAVGLKVIIGVFIEASGIGPAKQQVSDIVAWGQWSLVELIVVGNEAIFNGYVSASDLAGFVSSAKAAFAAAGYTGPVTTTEPLNILQQYTSVLCAVVDVVGCNIHPFFNADVDASSAGSFVASQLALVDGLCAGKSGVNLETGWPSGGVCNGAACPGQDQQKVAVEGILSTSGGKSVLFSYVNDDWKDPGAFDCEQNWGAIHLFQ